MTEKELEEYFGADKEALSNCLKYGKSFTCPETRRVLYGLPKYKSTGKEGVESSFADQVVASSSKSSEPPAKKAKVAKAAKAKGKAKAKAAAPEGDEAAAGPAKKPKALTAAQRTRCAKLAETVANLIADLEEQQAQVKTDELKDEVPPSLGNKIDIALALLKQSMASLELIHSDEWAGDVGKVISQVAKEVQEAGATNKKAATLIGMAQ